MPSRSAASQAPHGGEARAARPCSGTAPIPGRRVRHAVLSMPHLVGLRSRTSPADHLDPAPRPHGAARHRLRSFLVALAGLVALGVPAKAGVAREDIEVWRFIFQARFADYAQREDGDQTVWDISYEMGKPQGTLIAHYRMLAKGVTLMAEGRWDEGLELATLLDMRVSSKLVEPGETVEVRVTPLFRPESPLENSYRVRVELIDREGRPICPSAEATYGDLSEQTFRLRLPGRLAPGRYGVRYQLNQDSPEGAGPIVTSRRNLSVISDLKKRLKKLEKLNNKLSRSKKVRAKRRLRLAGESVLWYLETYKATLEASFTGQAIFLSTVSRRPRRSQRLDFVNELAFAEELAEALSAGRDLLATRAGDMRLAAASSVDGKLIPFRIFVSEGFDPTRAHPLVVGLHGAGSNENAYMDFYEGSFKRNARERGYLAVAPNGRGRNRRTNEELARDLMDVVDLVREVYPIDKTRTYLTGHSLGGGMTIVTGFDYADRFAALAPVAGFFGYDTRLAKAKEMPVLMAQGDTDRVVPVSLARAAYKKAQSLKMPAVEYIELEGVGHMRITTLVMDRVFDWFDRHAKQ